MSDSKNCCNDLTALLTKIIEQNNRLIEQHEVKDEIILQVLNENSELLAQLSDVGQVDATDGARTLDMD